MTKLRGIDKISIKNNQPTLITGKRGGEKRPGTSENGFFKFPVASLLVARINCLPKKVSLKNYTQSGLISNEAKSH